MIKKIKIYSLIAVLFSIITGSVGCVSSGFRLQESQVDGMRPFMERTTDEEKIDISIPVYKF